MKKYLIKEYSPIAPPFGGVSVYLRRLIKQLNTDGITTGGYYTSENKDVKVIESSLFELFDWRPDWPRVKKLLFHIRRLISASKQYEIIHLHGPELMILPALLHFFNGQKFIVTVHNAMVGNDYYHFPVYDRLAFKYLAKNNIQWIAVSEQAKEQLLSLPVFFKNPIKVIPAYLPDQSNYYPLSKSLTEYVMSHQKIITFYGRSFMTYKDHDVYGFKTAVKVYHRIKERLADSIGFVMCISDDSNIECIKELHQFAKRLKIDSAIFWQEGGIDSIRSLWKASDVYIRPTYTDGDSVSIRDAMAEGAIVVASDVCSRPEDVLVYQYGDDLALENTIIRALEMKGKPFSKMLYYEEMKKVYNHVLAQ